MNKKSRIGSETISKATVSSRELSRENELAILEWIRLHGRLRMRHVGEFMRLLCWATGCVLAAILASSLEDALGDESGIANWLRCECAA